MKTQIEHRTMPSKDSTEKIASALSNAGRTPDKKARNMPTINPKPRRTLRAIIMLILNIILQA